MTARDPWSAKKSLYSTSATPAVQQARPKKRWSLPGFLWLMMRRTCTAIGAFVLITVFIIVWSFSSALQNVDRPRALPEKFVLYMDFDGKLGDLQREASLADPFASPGPTLKEWLDTLERARTDKRVQGIYARMEAGGYALAHIQEMRAAVKTFRESGKFTYIYSTSYGDFGGLGNYYLALAFEQIWMQPMGVVAVTGVNAELPFFRAVLDKLGVEPQFFQRKEFKSAYENITHSQITEPNKRMMEYLIKDLTDTLGEEIAADLNMTPEAFKVLVDKGLLTADESVEAGLIHYADYADVLVKQINSIVTGDPDVDAEYISFSDYIREGRPKENIFSEDLLAKVSGEKAKDKAKAKDEKPGIALIYAVGVIMPSGGDDTPDLFDDGIAAADQIGAALIQAAEDENIQAVVLRVDSPGGSPVASETILRAVELVQQQGKPVIVSMGPTAASGGYWISAYADQIFVLPTTVTGSIGVVGGKFSMRGLWTMLGVNWERVQWGANAGMWSSNTPFSEGEAERVNVMLDNVYNSFIERVALGRKMTPEQVDRIAGGRIWTGKSAVKVGLADRIGGLNDALDYAAKQVGKKTRGDVRVIIMPKPLTPIERLLNMLEREVYARNAFRTQAQVMEHLQPFFREAAIIQNPMAYSVYSPVEIKP